MGNSVNVASCVCGEDERRKSNPKGSIKTSHGSMSSSHNAMLEYRPIGEYVIYLAHATNVPSVHYNSLSNCYVDIHLVSDTTFVSPLFRSTIRVNTSTPVWNSYIAFPVVPEANDKLILRLYDSGTLNSLKIGTFEISISKLRQYTIGNLGSFPLKLYDTDIPAPNPSEPTLIHLSSLGATQGPVPRSIKAPDSSFSITKDLFLIRHGESIWNEGKRDSNLIKLIGDYDHPLNSQGVKQAVHLNQQWKQKCSVPLIPGMFPGVNKSHQNQRKHIKSQLEKAHQTFLNAEIIISSPMTRACQTALVSLQGHPALANKPLLLFRNLREKKGSIRSLDCVGSVVGQRIKERVKEELLKIVNEEVVDEGNAAAAATATTVASSNATNNTNEVSTITKEDVAAVMSPDINCNDCNSMWWTSPGSGDSEDMMQSRFSELWRTLKYRNEKSIILVGHSSFFLEMMKKHIDDASFQGEQKIFSDNLKEYKLDNGACLHIRVTFDQLTWKGNWSAPKIVHAELLFGSQLKTVKE